MAIEDKNEIIPIYLSDRFWGKIGLGQSPPIELEVHKWAHRLWCALLASFLERKQKVFFSSVCALKMRTPRYETYMHSIYVFPFQVQRVHLGYLFHRLIIIVQIKIST